MHASAAYSKYVFDFCAKCWLNDQENHFDLYLVKLKKNYENVYRIYLNSSLFTKSLQYYEMWRI